MDHSDRATNDANYPRVLSKQESQSTPCARSTILIVSDASGGCPPEKSTGVLTIKRWSSDTAGMSPEPRLSGMNPGHSVNQKLNHLMGCKSTNILLIDDDLVDRMAFRRTLERLGIANPITEASNGIDALEILRGTCFVSQLARLGIVFLDLNMPRMSGLEFLHELRRDVLLQSVTVIVLTSSAMDESLVRSSSNDVVDFVNKNNLIHDLMSIISLPEGSLSVTDAISTDGWCHI